MRVLPTPSLLPKNNNNFVYRTDKDYRILLFLSICPIFSFFFFSSKWVTFSLGKNSSQNYIQNNLAKYHKSHQKIREMIFVFFEFELWFHLLKNCPKYFLTQKKSIFTILLRTLFYLVIKASYPVFSIIKVKAHLCNLLVMKNLTTKRWQMFLHLLSSILISLSRNYLPGQVNFWFNRSTGQISKNKSQNLTWCGEIED